MKAIKRFLPIEKLAQLCFLGFVFCIPFQIQTFLLSADAYGAGLFNPFLSVFLTLSDLFLLLALLLWGVAVWLGRVKIPDLSERQRKLILYILLLFIALEVNLFWSVNLELSLFYTFRFVEFFVFFLLFSFRLVSFHALKRAFLLSILLQSFVGIFQYLEQGSLGLGFLGEPSFDAKTLDVAKMDYVGGKLIRPYGTFSHPNILGAYLLIAILLSLFSWRREKILYSFFLIVFLMAFLLVFSRAAFLALVFALLFYFSTTNRKFPVLYILLSISLIFLFLVVFDLMPFILDALILRTGIFERFELFDISKLIFYENPLGIGLGNFTYVMQDYVSFKLNPWELQPVHNVFLLVLVEGGIVVFALLLLLYIQVFRFIYRLYKKYKKRLLAGTLLSIWAGLIVLGIFDHYLISLYQGQFIFWLFLAMVSHYLELQTAPLESSEAAN